MHNNVKLRGREANNCIQGSNVLNLMLGDRFMDACLAMLPKLSMC